MDDFAIRPESPVTQLHGIGPARAGQLAALGICSLRDFLFHFPREYQDRRTYTKLGDLEQGKTVTVFAEIVKSRMIRLRGRANFALVTLRDDTGEASATWFGRGFLANTFKPGTKGVFTGLVGSYKGPCLKNPDYELQTDEGDAENIHTGRIVPIYRLTEGITQRVLRRWMWDVLQHLDMNIIPPVAPQKLLESHGYDTEHLLLREVHFPSDLETANAARERFAYEELLVLETGILLDRARRLHQETGICHKTAGASLRGLRKSLPFTLTRGQSRAVADILKDMASPRPMARLIQGDVGCGKTVVAMHAVAAAADGGWQTAVMAPTEVLAEQHFLGMHRMLSPLGLQVELLTGNVSSAASRKRIASGNVHVIVGTHTLIQEKTVFSRLGLVIVDEQHRFGVLQRTALVQKGTNPDFLQMTATPIPRTLALTLYGSLDITVIEDLPEGRLPVKTRRVPKSKVADLYAYIVGEAVLGRQAYIICPLVEDSDARAARSVLSHFDELAAGPLADVRVAVLHGRMDRDEKEEIMRAFKSGELDVLMSTTVIEVGVDAPNATIIVIEDASQFGLTQLHQLRGRVGRNSQQSYCFLMGEPTTDDGKKRLEILCATTSGFDIAEEDLKLRGPGEFHGLRQAGACDLRVADLVRDARLLDRARRDAEAILDLDPRLTEPEHAPLAQAISTRLTALP